MAKYRITAPDGGSYEVTAPDTASEAEVMAYAQKNYKQPEAKPEKSAVDKVKQGVGNLAAGMVRGAGSIGATILAPVDMASDALAGKGLSLESNRQRRAAMDAGLETMGAEPDSLLYQGGKLAGEIAGTAGAGSVVAAPLKAAGVAPRLVQAISTAGMRTGGAPVSTLAGRAGDLGLRMAGGAINGGVAAGMVNPEDVPTGVAVGAALPPAIIAAGKVGKAIGGVLRGPGVPQATKDAVIAAREAGYVIPPTQASPTLGNRVLEGMSGKLTTAQNASAKNQPITNELARKAIGAADLSPAGLAEVRKTANAAYSELGNAGTFTTDDAFRKAIESAGNRSEKFAADFPELVTKDVDNLLEKFANKESFDAQSALEAIKRLREAQRAGLKAFDDAEKKAYAKVQGKVADALEGVVERNLEQTGALELLTSFRNARQTLAKVYDVEKALNKASGNVDAGKLAALLKKDRPLTGELRTIAEFAQQFPKANQTMERMGSLPQTSPLDWGAAGITSAATGNPLMMAGVLARPAARAAILSNPVQNRLAQTPGTNRLGELLGGSTLQQLPYRAAPAISSQ